MDSTAVQGDDPVGKGESETHSVAPTCSKWLKETVSDFGGNPWPPILDGELHPVPELLQTQSNGTGSLSIQLRSGSIVQKISQSSLQ